jgi:hypothetical protein
MTKLPVGRTTHMSLYSPGGETPITFPDGTWLEAESFAYPNGGFTRRAYASFPDGSKKVVKVSVPDTFFSIPARAKINGKTVKGYVSTNENTLTFTVTTEK